MYIFYNVLKFYSDSRPLEIGLSSDRKDSTLITLRITKKVAFAIELSRACLQHSVIPPEQGIGGLWVQADVQTDSFWTSNYVSIEFRIRGVKDKVSAVCNLKRVDRDEWTGGLCTIRTGSGGRWNFKGEVINNRLVITEDR